MAAACRYSHIISFKPSKGASKAAFDGTCLDRVRAGDVQLNNKHAFAVTALKLLQIISRSWVAASSYDESRVRLFKNSLGQLKSQTCREEKFKRPAEIDNPPLRDQKVHLC